jgi:hypothetical protein
MNQPSTASIQIVAELLASQPRQANLVAELLLLLLLVLLL